MNGHNKAGSINWLNLLPSLTGKSVLKFGTDKVENISVFLRYNCKSICCVGPNRPELSYSQKITYCHDFFSLNQRSFDVCIIDEMSFIENVASSQELKKYFTAINQVLTDNGILLIGLSNGYRCIKFKLTMAKLLYAAGLKKVDSFFCHPSFEKSSIIYPYSQDRKYTLKLISEINLDGTIRELLKSHIKRLFLKISPYLNNFCGICLIARKSSTAHDNDIVHLLVTHNNDDSLDINQLYPVWYLSHSKQLGMIHYGHGNHKEVLAVYKQSFVGNERSDRTTQEYKNITLLSEYNAEFDKNNILLPRPIYFKADDIKICSIESAVTGCSMETLKIGYNRGRLIAKLMSKLDQLVSIQIFLQSHLSKTIKDKVPQVSAMYFENTSDIPSDQFRIDSYKSYVQHGDFTDMNMIYNAMHDKWGLIDWEGLASGYPHFFDLFYLFTSLEYRTTDKMNKSLLDHYFHSFTETFFQVHYLSNYIGNIVPIYCGKFALNQKQLFDWFMDFLSFNYNKYRMFYKDLKLSAAYAELYKEMIHYSIKNKDNFLPS